MELVDDCGFTDTGVPRYEHQLRRAARDYSIEGGEKGLDLPVPPVKLLREHESIGHVVLSQREVRYVALFVPLGNTLAKVTLYASRGLIAVLGRSGCLAM